MQAQQNKGTLVPGQIITVNQYQVQVEKYLSQGGFAHVYLVRTPQPVFGTTHHVLKRIAVANDAMLEEVKKEVGIMRILRGHPNIVYLIDASWTQMPNGMTEAFVLMEFCQGGGIIDMMNRRLRERLTEAEILTIFVDVCEGVAAMHNLKPALLHRDLKVENILQSSATSYKLCDFGSSAPVSRPPSSTAEIRMVEADLNRHTTLQYRAPEMVDAYLRRPIDEKSDVWALGVLLYKLCYYTTPFEEHGPLAILNVQYRIPPYPVYSSQMNTLIASMLKEHGTQRPSVFDILNLVHALRGSTSRFSYNIPAVAPLSPSLHRQPANPLDDVVSYRPKSSTGNGNMQPRQEVEPGGGLQARDRVLEAIAPMRRGRPQMASPAQTGASPAPTLMTASKSGTAKILEGLTFSQTSNKSGSDPWAVSNAAYQGSSSNTKSNGFADSFDGTPSSAPRMPTLPPRPSISANVTSSSSRVPGVGVSTYTKDAFAGLGLAFADTKASPTLGEARKMRTGLASMGSYSSTRDPTAGLNMNTSMNMPSSPRPRSTLAAPDVPGRQPTSPKPRPTSGLGPPSPKPHGRSAPPSTDLTPEERFPSLEDLDRKYGSASSRASNAASIKTEPQTSHSRVATGTAMRDTPSWMTDYHTTSLNDAKTLPQGDYLSHPARDRPQLSRKHRSSTNTRSTTMDKSDSSTPSGNSGVKSTILSPDSITSARAPSPSRVPPQDWLTGDDDSPLNMLDVRAANNGTPQPPGTPVLRESPSKRASYIQDSGIKFQSPKHASPQQVGTRDPASTSSISTGPTLGSRFTTVSNPASGHGSSTADKKPTNFGTTSNWAPTSPSKGAKSRQLSKQGSDSSDDGPEDAGRFGRPLPGLQTNAARSTGGHGGGKQSSVHELADRYGGLGVPTSPSKAVTGAGVQRRRSAVYPSMSATGRTSPSKTKKYTPQPITNVGRSTSPTKRPPSAQHRKQPSVTHAYVSPSPRTVASPSSATRARPQSMFMHPMSTSKSAEANLSLGQPTTVATPVSTHKVMSPGLVAPPDTRHKAQRRSSISDMVQMYESIASPGPVAAPKAMPPPVANKPAGLRVGTNTYQPPPSAPSPSPSLSSIAARFPALSPNTSPVLSRAELSKGSQPQISQNANGRTSPMLMRRASPLLGTPAPEPTWTGNTPVLAAPKPMSNDLMPPMSRPSAVARSSSGGEGENDNRSPSPSKPYQGVGKLIDRWQRNIADANPTIAGGPRVMPTGVKPRGGSTGKR